MSRQLWLGAGMVVLAATLLSATSISAVVSYGGGANPFAVMIVRFVGAIIVLYGLLRLSGTPAVLAPRTRNFALVLGIAQAAQSWFLYTSLDHIPVGLAMIIFYVYPLFVGALASAIGQESMTRALVSGLAVAFVGLLFVFNVTGDGLDLVGAGAALGAAVSWTLVVVFSTSLAQGKDARPVTFHVQASALVCVLLSLLAVGDPRLPSTTEGWVGYLLMPVFYGLGVTCFFVATSMIGSVRSALIMNTEALIATLMGFVVLGQTLTVPQLFGGAIVIAAVFAARWGGEWPPGKT